MNSIASLRPYSFAKYWTLDGHEVTVLTTEKVKDPATDYQMENPGFQILEVPLPPFFKTIKSGHLEQSKRTKLSSKFRQLPFIFFDKIRNTTGILRQSRMPDITDLWVKPAIRRVKAQEWDVVLSSAGPYTVHLVGYHLKKNCKTKHWIADYRDPWTNNIYFSGLFPFTLLEKYLERKIIKKADVVTTVSTPLVDDMRHYFKSDHVYEVTNGFDLDDLSPLGKNPVFPADERVRILYTGSIFPGKQNILPLFEAISKMKRDPTTVPFLKRLEIIILSRQKSYIDHLVANYGIEEIVLTREVTERSEALKMQRDADLLLFLPWTDKGQEGVLTGKLFEYLFSGTPIVCIGVEHVEEAQRLILKLEAGITLSSVPAIISYLKKTLKNPKIQKREIPDWFLKAYSRKELAKKMLALCFSEKK